MFKIVNSAGLVLPLPKGFTINIERINPLFNNSDEFFQDLSYPGTVPLTDPVKLFIGHGHLPETPNAAHSINVAVFFEATPLSEGIFNFNVRGNDIEFNLELNYTALNALIQDIRITDIRTGDKMDLMNEAAFTALMTETAQDPGSHPFIFFPLHDPGQSDALNDGRAQTYRPFVNYYDTALDQFKMTVFVPFSGGNIYGNGQQPFYKLTYLLKKVINYLGFEAGGGLFNDPKFAGIVVLTRYSSGFFDVAEMSKYLPNLLISDLLKFVRDRFHIIVDVNSATRLIRMTTLADLASSTDPIDLTPYVGAFVEQELTESRTGFTVTIKPDQQDDAFKTVFDGNDSWIATERLVVGAGGEQIELDCTTTKTVDLSAPGIPGKRYASIDQTIINNDNWSGFPPDITEVTALGSDPSKTNAWPLKLARYIGMRNLPGGKHFPCSEAVDLDQDDIDFYRFRTAGKRVILTCYFPPSVLASLDLTRKYCYRTPDLNYIYLVIEKYSYDIGNDMDVVPVKLYTYVLAQTTEVAAAIVPVTPPDEFSVYTFGYLTAYFDTIATGLEKVEIEVAGIGASAGNVYQPVTISNPTNSKGAGGVAMPIVWLNGPEVGFPINPYHIQLRVKNGKPKHVDHLGFRRYFTWSGSYWYVDLNIQINADAPSNIFSEPYWIVF